MGFMSAAGAFSESFGKAFSNSYSQTQDTIARREAKAQEQKDDIFKLTLKEQMDNKEELRKQKAKESGLTATAEAIAAETGGPKDKIAELLLRNADADVVRSLFKGRKWSPTGEVTQSQENTITTPATSGNNGNYTGRSVDGRLPKIDSDEGVAAAAGATDAQMQSVFPRTDPTTMEAMPTTPATPQAPSPISNDSITVGGMTGTLIKDPLTYNQTKDQLRIRLVQETDPEKKAQLKQQLLEMAQAESIGEDPKVTSEAALYEGAASDDPVVAAKFNKALDLKERADALKAIRDGKGGLFVYAPASGRLVQAEPNITPDGRRQYVGQDGNVIEGAIQPDERFNKKYDEIIGLKSEKPVQDYDTRLAATTNVVKSAAELAQIVEKNPDVLTATASAAEFAKGLTKEAQAAFNILQSENRDTIDPVQLDSLDKDINFLSQRTNDTAELSAIYQVKKQVLAVRLAQMNGEAGRGMSNADFQRNLDTIQPSKDKDTVVRNLANISAGAVSDLRPVAATLNNDPRVTSWPYGRVPIEGGFIAEPFDQYVARMNDPQINQSLEYLKGKEGSPVTSDPEQTTETTGEIARPQGPDDFAKLKSGTLFIDPEGNTRRKP